MSARHVPQYPQTGGVPAREQRGAAGAAGRAGDVGLLEVHAFLRQAVDVGRLEHGVTVSQVGPAQVIHEQQHDIRPVLGLGIGAQRARRDQDRCERRYRYDSCEHRSSPPFRRAPWLGGASLSTTRATTPPPYPRASGSLRAPRNSCPPASRNLRPERHFRGLVADPVVGQLAQDGVGKWERFFTEIPHSTKNSPGIGRDAQAGQSAQCSPAL